MEVFLAAGAVILPFVLLPVLYPARRSNEQH